MEERSRRQPNVPPLLPRAAHVCRRVSAHVHTQAHTRAHPQVCAHLHTHASTHDYTQIYVHVHIHVCVLRVPLDRNYVGHNYTGAITT